MNDVILTPEAFSLLRKSFPEIPEKCDWIKISMSKDNIPYIECGFYPTKTKNVEKK